MTVPLHRGRRPRALRAVHRRHGRGDEPAAGRGAVPAPGDPARPAQGGGVQRGPRAHRPARCSSSATSSPRRRRQQLLPDERDHLAVARSPAPVARGPVEPDRPVDVYDVGRRARALAEALELADLAARRGSGAGLRSRPERARSRSTGPRSATSGALAPARARRRSASPEPAVAFELDVDGLLGGARPRPGVPPAVALPGVAASTSRSCCPRPCRPRPSSGRCATRAATCSSRSRCFDEFRAEALGPAGAASRSRCASGRRTARSPTPRSAELRQRGHRRGRRGARRRAAR